MLRLSRAAEALKRPIQHVRARTGVLRGLDFLWLEITRSCNLTCGHCYAGSSPELPLIERMRFEDWCGVMNEAIRAGCRRLQFVGGEPTIHPDLPRLIEHSFRVGFEFREVFTNATVLREELLDCFETFGVQVAFSFYSTEAAVHDRITGQTGSFRRTVEGIRRLAGRKIPLRAGLILVEQNGDDGAAAAGFLRDLGVERVGIDRVRGIGRGLTTLGGADPEAELCGECWKGNLCVDPAGEVFPCVFSRFAPVGNLFEQSLTDVVNGGRLRAFRRRSFLDEKGG